MATARDDGNPYAGLGAGGKFRKKPYRKPQSTPYDRPPAAIRNPTIVPGAGGNGWLRKLVDPAQKLLASTAKRFYASVFRKRLTQASPPPPQPPGAEQEAGDKHVTAIPLNISKEQEAAHNGNQNPTPSFVPGERSSMELEEILKQKTFTRSEIDHLMGLLSARVDNSVQEGEKTPDVPSRGLYRDHKEEVVNVPLHLQDNGSGRRLLSSRAANSSVSDEDIASPAELAKAYIASRQSKMSPSMLGIRSQALAEDSTVLNGLARSSNSPILSLVPSSSGHVGVRENGYATPRSRGRSAIYSMARTPYSRVHLTSTPKSSGLLTSSYDGPSSMERDSIFGSSKAPKRSSSIFENDIGSGGPMRRVRQKPNLSHRKNWIMTTSETGEPSSSAPKMQPVRERKLSFTEQSNAAPVSSQSAAMASKILQQLDKIVSPPKDRSSELKLALAREKAPANLSASKLQGQALKSLEHVDSSKFLELSKDKNKSDDAVARFLHDSGETSKGKQHIVEQNGPSSIFAASDKVSPSINGMENSLFAKKDVISIVRAADTNLTNSLDPAPVQKKRAFRMSAHEDFLDLEDDVYSNGLSSPTVKVKEKQDTSTVEHKPTAVQANITSEKHQTVSSPINFSMKETASQGANGTQIVPETRADFSFPRVSAASTSSQPDALAVQSPSEPDRVALTKESDAALPMFSSGDKVGLKDQSVQNSIFGLPSNNESTTNGTVKTPQLKFGEAPSGGFFGQRTLGAQSSSSDASVAGGLFSSTAKVPESGKTEDKKPLKDGVFSGVPDSAAVPAASSATFTFGIKSANLSNGSTVSTANPEDSNTSQKPFAISSPVSFGGNNSSSDLSSTTTASASSLPTFAFGASSSSSTSQASSTITTASEEAKTKASVGSGNIISNPFDAANSSPGGSIFGFGATSATSTANNNKEGSAIAGAANGPTVVPESPATGAGLASFSQSVPVQFGPSSSSALSTTIAASTVSSLFDSSSAAKPFPSFGSSAALSSGTSSLSPSSPSLFGQGTASSAFSSSLALKSPSTAFPFGSSSSFVFGSAPGSSSASSSASVFGVSGTAPGSSSASSSASVFGVSGTAPGSSSASSSASVFGVSGTAPAFGSNMGSSMSSPALSMGAPSGTTFSFTSAPVNSSSGPAFPFAPVAPSPLPMFGSSNPPFAFGSPAPVGNNNNDQMSMEDSMAEDPFQANHGSTTPVPVFGQQQPVSPPPAFMFGSNAATGANPFQFGAPQNPSMPQNPSPFQASGSQNFNSSGGSFSLGTGGGDKSSRRVIKVRKGRKK